MAVPTADASAADATLTTTFPTNRRFPLTLALGTGLLVVPPLAKLGVETGPLHLALEPAKRAVEALVVLNDDFQEITFLGLEPDDELEKLNPGKLPCNAGGRVHENVAFFGNKWLSCSSPFRTPVSGRVMRSGGAGSAPYPAVEEP